MPALRSRARSSLRAFVLSLCALVAVVPVPALAETEDRALTSGLSLGAGWGLENALLGVHAAYWLQLPSERWRIAPHLGAGYPLGPTAAGGVLVAFGRHHRLVLDVLVAPFSAWSLSGTGPDEFHASYGIAAVAGWEWVAPYGLWFRGPLVGLGYGFEDHEPGVAFSVFSFGYKLW